MRALKAAGKAGRSSSPSRRLGSSPKRAKICCRSFAGRSISKLAMSARTASNSPVSASAALARGGRFEAARQRNLGHDVSARDTIGEVGVGQHGRVLKHRPGCFRFVRRQCEHQCARRIAGPAQSLRQRPAHAGPKGRRAARSSPARLRRGRRLVDRNKDRRGRARSPLAPAHPRRRIAPRLEIDALCRAWRRDGAGSSSVVGRLACMSASLAGHGGRC